MCFAKVNHSLEIMPSHETIEFPLYAFGKNDASEQIGYIQTVMLSQNKPLLEGEVISDVYYAQKLANAILNVGETAMYITKVEVCVTNRAPFWGTNPKSLSRRTNASTWARAQSRRSSPIPRSSTTTC